jgi:hypothetical protein
MTPGFFNFHSVSPESLQKVIREMGAYGFNLTPTAQDPNAFSVSGHGLVGTATYRPSVQHLAVVIMERTGLAKMITDDVINERLLAALGRA